MFALGKGSAELRKVFQTAWSRRQNLTGYALLSLSLFLSISTGAFTHLERLGLPSLTAWIKAFDLPREGQPWYWHLQLIAVYDPLIMVLGLLGAGYALFRWREARAEGTVDFPTFLVFWASGSLILLALMGRKEAGQILSPLLPLALLAGSLVGELAKRLNGQSLRQVIIPWQRQNMALVVIAPLLGLGLIYSIHTSWSLNYDPGAMEWLAPCITSPRVSEMVKAAEDISKSLPDPKAKVAVESTIRQPFAWYLRHRENVEYVGKWTTGAPMIIARPEEQTHKEFSGYTMRLQGDLCTEWSRGPFNFRDFWHWLVYREGWGDQRQVPVALYLRR
jgi:predicted membrane-bound mannosyltransferase